METAKKPHHLSKEGRALREQENNGNADLQEKLENVQNMTNPVEQKEESQQISNQGEVTVPLSVVEKMIADAMKNVAPVQQFQQQAPAPIQYVKQEYDIDDIPECRNWEAKDREYEYIGGKPISASIPSKHTDLISLQYYNKEKNTTHALRYSSNQPSFFSEKQSKEPGSVFLPEIIFDYGRLKVPASNVNLQKFLHIHPFKDVIFKEYDPKAKSRKVISDEKLLNKAVNLVFEETEITNRSIASLECPSYVESWDLEMVTEHILVFAKSNPQKYIDYTEDPAIKIKGVIKSSLASGELIYENYRFMTKNREPITEVPKNQDEIEEMVKYFQSGVGRSQYEYLLNILGR